MAKEKVDTLDAVRKDIEKREARLYRQKQKAIKEILDRARKEDWIGEIARSKTGKIFLFDLAIKSCEVSLLRLLPERSEQHVSYEGDPLILEIRRFLNGDGEEKKNKRKR